LKNFITNDSPKNLKGRLLELISKSKELKFLVGFFYFSGIKELYEGLNKNPDVTIKVLVGLDVDRTNFGLIEYATDVKKSDNEKTYDFFASIKKSINTEFFDTQEFYSQVRFFLELIEQEKLIIRKTYKPNHAKLYLFKMDETQITKRELFITGSSNLTRSGITTQNEFNVEISDYGFPEAEEYFDSLWAEAVKITDFAELKKKLIILIEQQTLVKEITPFEAFALVLKTYLDLFQDQKEVGTALIDLLEKNGYTPYRYQLDAVSQALSIIEKHNGVIVADVVGLGKTIIACAIAKQLRKRGIVICPPGLIGDRNKNSGWKKYLEEFGLYDWEVRSIGDLEETLKFVNRADDIEVVIIDEAHRFRNEDTIFYDKLKSICRAKQVILLTATPFNNRPADILALLSLFIVPKKSNITLHSNLIDQFRAFKGIFDRLGFIKKNHNSDDDDKRKKAQNLYKALFQEERIDLSRVADRSHYLARQIRNVIEPVTIRRNRLDLLHNPNYKTEVTQLSKVMDPLEWYFELTPSQSEFYDQIIGYYFSEPKDGGQFKGAIYRPFVYERGLAKTSRDLVETSQTKMSMDDNRQYIQQTNLFDFMRRLIVKRFESSFGSFRQSIINFQRITGNCLTFIEKTGEYILDRSLLEKIYEMDLDRIEEYLIEYEEKIVQEKYPKNHKRYKIKNFKQKEQFIADIKSDLQLFKKILQELTKLDLVANDPKTACLISHIKSEFNKKPKEGEPSRKIIIFSEYVDTVKYLEKSLKQHYKDRLLVVSGDLSTAKLKQINRNFDASYQEQEDEFDILLSSDRISEGFNLNRAGMVINYDIPWNPVRVIQRLGRINRISKKVFNELYIVNFFPTEKGSVLVKSREIAANKMFLIHTALGEDSKIFDIDEEPSPAGLYSRINKNPDELDEESFYTKVLNEFSKIKQEHPDLINSFRDFPPRIKVAKKGEENELFVFFKKDRLYVGRAQTTARGKAQPDQTSLEDIIDLIRCEPDEEKLNWNTDQFWHTYEAIKNFRVIHSNPTSEQSVEMKALNNLNFLINNLKPSIMPYSGFLRTLREDIQSYGTLPDYTLRRIMNFKEDRPEEIKELMNEIGENYLTRELERLKDNPREIIISIENRKL